MVTVGGVLPDEAHHHDVRRLVASPAWRCMADEPINSPPLTPKEIAALKTLLPASAGISPSRVEEELGIRLSEDALNSFARYYLDYPMYVQAAR